MVCTPLQHIVEREGVNCEVGVRAGGGDSCQPATVQHLGGEVGDKVGGETAISQPLQHLVEREGVN